jgi:hypothetical protein
VDGLQFGSTAPGTDAQRQFERAITLVEQNRTLAGDLLDAISGGALVASAS